MSVSDDTTMYASIGHAVGMCQLFEFIFTVCVKLVYKQKDVTSADDLAPLDSKSFRVAITGLLNELKQVANVHPEFEAKIIAFSDRRHTLIHRWFNQHGWPEQDKDKTILTDFARSLGREALDLSTVLGGYVISWMKRFPATRDGAESREQDWAELLAQANLSLRVEA